VPGPVAAATSNREAERLARDILADGGGATAVWRVLISTECCIGKEFKSKPLTADQAAFLEMVGGASGASKGKKIKG
jgi:hypothetical protein